LTLANYSINPGALLRARNRAFNAFDAQSDGYGQEKVNRVAAELARSCTLVLKAASGQIVDGVRYELDTYDGHDALLIYTPAHKIVCVRLGPSTQEYRPFAIFDL